MVDMVNRSRAPESPHPIILQPLKCQRQKGQRELETSRKKDRRQPVRAAVIRIFYNRLRLRYRRARGQAQFRHRLNRSIRREHLRQPAF
jgi:hypothetical protein